MISYDFSGKIVLVTASSRGIGFGIAKAFHGAGAKVVINSRNISNLKKAEKTLSSIDSSRVYAVSGDISQYDFLQSLVLKVENHFNDKIDILVNNSGGPPAGEAMGFSDDDWKGAIDNNLLSTIRLTSLVTIGMKHKGWGRVVNLTSLLAKEPAVGMVLSNVTRAGVAAYSKTISKELGRFGITVNTILTGGCLTERFYSLAEKQIEQTKETLEEAIERMQKNVPVQHISTPEEFAQAILFLSSDSASYITGTSIPIDGGNSNSTY